jgi:hypothetical protein
MLIEIDGNIVNFNHVKSVNGFRDRYDSSTSCRIRFIDGSHTDCPVSVEHILGKIQEYESNHRGK